METFSFLTPTPSPVYIYLLGHSFPTPSCPVPVAESITLDRPPKPAPRDASVQPLALRLPPRRRSRCSATCPTGATLLGVLRRAGTCTPLDPKPSCTAGPWHSPSAPARQVAAKQVSTGCQRSPWGHGQLPRACRKSLVSRSRWDCGAGERAPASPRLLAQARHTGGRGRQRGMKESPRLQNSPRPTYPPASSRCLPTLAASGSRSSALVETPTAPAQRSPPL